MPVPVSTVLSSLFFVHVLKEGAEFFVLSHLSQGFLSGRSLLFYFLWLPQMSEQHAGEIVSAK